MIKVSEDEINRILEKTKKKIAISQFKKERIEDMKNTKENKFVLIKRIGIGTAAGLVLTVGSVGAYVGVTGNTDILKNIGINIGEKYEEEKQGIEGAIYGDGVTINLVSAACDSTCIVLEADIKLDKNGYKEIDFNIENLTLKGNNFVGSTNNGLNLSENSASSVMEDGTIKLFKYISIKDPNLAGDGFLDALFSESNKADCKIEISKLYDKESKKIIANGKWEFDFTLEGKEESEFVNMDKKINVKDVDVDVLYVAKSSLGNYITLIASQDNFDSNKENNIQKLEYIIKNSKGERINIVSRTYNISQEENDASKIYIETTIKLDDISNDVNYDIDVQIGEKENIKTSEITDVIKLIEELEKENNNEKQEEMQLSVINQEEVSKIEDNNKDNSSLFQKSPLDGNLIILTRYNDEEKRGIEIAAQEGKSIYSVNDGKVVDVGYDNKNGNYIVVEYENNIKVLFGTCSEILKSVGDKVKTGEVIAKTGNTGHSTGPHLHLEVLVNGIQDNPENYLK